MSAKTKMSITERLKEEIDKRGISVLKFIEETGLPKDRVYKWLKRGTANIGHQDALIIEAWISGKSIDNSTNEDLDKSKSGESDNLSRRDLEQTLKNMSEDKLHSTEIIKMLAEDKLRNTAIFEKLAALLESQFNSTQSSKSLLGPGLKGRLTGTPSPKQDLELDKKYSQEGKGARKHK